MWKGRVGKLSKKVLSSPNANGEQVTSTVEELVAAGAPEALVFLRDELLGSKKTKKLKNSIPGLAPLSFAEAENSAILGENFRCVSEENNGTWKEKQLYRRLPKTDPPQYVTWDEFPKFMRRTKNAELERIARDLGAKKICLESHFDDYKQVGIEHITAKVDVDEDVLQMLEKAKNLKNLKDINPKAELAGAAKNLLKNKPEEGAPSNEPEKAAPEEKIAGTDITKTEEGDRGGKVELSNAKLGHVKKNKDDLIIEIEFDEPSNPKPIFNEENLYWYYREPSWQSMVQSRLKDFSVKEMKFEYVLDEEESMTAEMKFGIEKNSQQITDLDIKGVGKTHRLKVKDVYKIEFFGKEAYQQHKTEGLESWEVEDIRALFKSLNLIKLYDSNEMFQLMDGFDLVNLSDEVLKEEYDVDNDTFRRKVLYVLDRLKKTVDCPHPSFAEMDTEENKAAKLCQSCKKRLRMKGK